MELSSPTIRYLRGPQVYGPTGRIPVARSTFYAWIAEGKAPAPVKLGPNTSAWIESEIDEFAAELASQRSPEANNWRRVGDVAKRLANGLEARR